MRFLPYLLIVAITLTACATNDDATLKDEELPLSIEADQDELTTVPVSLWSPSQRKARAGYYYLVAELMALEKNDPKKAKSIYRTSYNLDPNPFVGGKLIAAKAAAGQTAEAISEAKKMVLLYPTDAHLRFLYGNLLGGFSRYDEAVEQLEKSIDLNPKLEMSYLLLIELHERFKQQTKSIVIAKELVKAVPNSTPGWSQLSRLYMSSNQYKKALHPAKRAYEINSTNPTICLTYAVLLQLNGKPKKSLRLYEQLYRMNPASEQLIGQMVELYQKLGNLEDALELIDGMITSTKTTAPGILMQKAILLWELKRYDEAATLLDQLHKDYPDSDRLMYMAALGQEKLKRFKKSLITYGKIPENSQFRQNADYRTAIVYKHLKNYDKAIEVGIKITKKQKSEWDTFVLLAGIYSEAEKYSDAIETLEKGYKKFPDKHRLLFLIGVYQEKDKDIDGCIKTMRLVIKRDPKNSSAFNYLGYLFSEEGENLKEAEQLIKRALELKPGDGFYLDSLGWVYYKMGKLDKARTYIEDAVKAVPDEGVIIEHLADIEERQGNKELAVKLYKKALLAEISKKDKERVEEKLKKLEEQAKK